MLSMRREVLETYFGSERTGPTTRVISFTVTMSKCGATLEQLTAAGETDRAPNGSKLTKFELVSRSQPCLTRAYDTKCHVDAQLRQGKVKLELVSTTPANVSLGLLMAARWSVEQPAKREHCRPDPEILYCWQASVMTGNTVHSF